MGGRENDSRWSVVGGGEGDKRGRPISGRQLPGTKKERICSTGPVEAENTRVGLLVYAHAPTRLIQNAPPNTSTQAITRLRPRNTRQLSSLRKSSESSSTREAKISRPAEMAFMVPTSSSPTSESGLYSECVAMPIAWPIGVLDSQ